MNPFPLRRVAHPVLSLDQAKGFETRRFQGNEDAEWAAMSCAGEQVARGVSNDSRELRCWPDQAQILVLAGKGHNGGDALLAAKTLLQIHRDAVAHVLLPFGEAAFRPLALRAYQDLVHSAPKRVCRLSSRAALTQSFDVCLDGVFGFQFHPPVAPACAALFDRVNRAAVGLRAAIDLPSGLGTNTVLRADFTYATGSVKSPVLEPQHREAVGRLRYLDLGFFDTPEDARVEGFEKTAVLSGRTLDALRQWRRPLSDKRDYGHLFVVGGSRSYPGAVMMTVRAALRTGLGLLTAFVPESLIPGYAAHVPEAMWVGCPETPAGNLALEGLHLLKERASRATALAMGPGLGREPETLAFAREILKTLQLPAVIDADALQPEIVTAVQTSRILTPHAGEYHRLASNREAIDYAREVGATLVVKGSPTRVTDGRSVNVSLSGGPVLARGGSGDILTGMIGGLFAQYPALPLESACAGVLWHGLAADALARDRGAVAVSTTQLIDHLPEVLRAEGNR